MSKYSYEFKKKIVKDYLSGKGGYRFLAQQYGIPDKKQIQKWVDSYKTFGDEGLKRSREKKNYSFEFKLHVVELYLTTEVSYRELALSVGINNPSIVTKWVDDIVPFLTDCDAVDVFSDALDDLRFIRNKRSVRFFFI